MIPALLETGLKIVELLGRIKTRDPKTRAAGMRARAENLRTEAARLRTEAQRHELNGINSSNAKFHRRMVRRLDTRSMRLQARALWWDNRADRIDP